MTSRATLTRMPLPARCAVNSNKPKAANKVKAATIPILTAERRSDAGADLLKKSNSEIARYTAPSRRPTSRLSIFASTPHLFRTSLPATSQPSPSTKPAIDVATAAIKKLMFVTPG